MAGHTTFAGLRKLASQVGFKFGANDAPLEPEDENEAGEAEDEQDAPAGDPPAGDPPAGAPPAEDEEDDNGENDTTADGGTEGGGEPPVAGAAEQSQRRSADFLAGQRHGAAHTAGRWAAVLASPVARQNLEMATDLLATSNMTPSAIVEHCDRYKGESSAKRLLDTTPKPSVGARNGGSDNADTAEQSRKSAVAKVNKGVGGGRRASGDTPVRRSRRAAAAEK